jgi:hypothetical protein
MGRWGDGVMEIGNNREAIAGFALYSFNHKKIGMLGNPVALVLGGKPMPATLVAPKIRRNNCSHFFDSNHANIIYHEKILCGSRKNSNTNGGEKVFFPR